MDRINQKIVDFMLKKRSLTFHVIASILTYGFWIVLYFVSKRWQKNNLVKKNFKNDYEGNVSSITNVNPSNIRKYIYEYPKLMENKILKWAYYNENIFIPEEVTVDFNQLTFG